MLKISKYIRSAKPFYKCTQLRYLSSKGKKVCEKKKSKCESKNKKKVECPPRYECKQALREDVFDLEAEKKKIVHPFFKPSHKTNYKLWRNIFIFVCIPAIITAAISGLWTDEIKRRPKFHPFAHLRIRKKGYPWDPVKTLFHHPRYNALPDGYEFEVPEDEEEDDSSWNRCCPP